MNKLKLLLPLVAAPVKKEHSYIAWLVAGVVFAFLWASAATATKIGLTVPQPLVIALMRFGVASALMLCIAHGLLKHRLPTGKEWRQLLIYGLLNISLYLGLYVVAMQQITAGIGSLSIAANPVFISFLSVFFLKKRLKPAVVIAIVICTAGVVCAAWPLLADAIVTVEGLLLLLLSMLFYSAGAIYFSARNWNGLSLFVINGWQTLLGGLLLLPLTLFSYQSSLNHFNQSFWLSVAWLAIPVSIVAVMLWLWLLRGDAVKAGLWLYLCPVFGFVQAALVLGDGISIYTFIGVGLVLGGLLLAQKTGGK